MPADGRGRQAWAASRSPRHRAVQSGVAGGSVSCTKRVLLPEPPRGRRMAVSVGRGHRIRRRADGSPLGARQGFAVEPTGPHQLGDSTPPTSSPPSVGPNGLPAAQPPRWRRPARRRCER
jgi:hypothetical protein